MPDFKHEISASGLSIFGWRHRPRSGFLKEGEDQLILKPRGANKFLNALWCVPYHPGSRHILCWLLFTGASSGHSGRVSTLTSRRWQALASLDPHFHTVITHTASWRHADRDRRQCITTRPAIPANIHLRHQLPKCWALRVTLRRKTKLLSFYVPVVTTARCRVK